MTQPTQAIHNIPRAALDAVTQPITADGVTGMPNAAYTDWNCFNFERDNLFADTWTAIAFCDDHRDAGVITPVDFMGLPLLIVCKQDGELAVYHNVCSHRGTRLVTEPKKTNGLVVCPYHAWSYDLNGALKATPHIGGVGNNEAEGFCREQHGLKVVRSQSWMGVLFINLSGDAQAFDEYAAPLNKRYQQFIGDNGGAEMQCPVSHEGLTLTAECNWKLAVENYCEAYHLPWVHPSLNSYSPLDRHYCMEISDDFAGQGTNTFNPTFDGVADLPTFQAWPEDKHKIAEYPVFYPNLLLGYQVNHFYALIIHPLAPNRTREELKIFYLADGATSEQHTRGRQTYLESWQKIFNEDIAAIEGMQHGRNSPAFKGGAFSPVLDAPTHHFHKWVARKYAGGV